MKPVGANKFFFFSEEGNYVLNMTYKQIFSCRKERNINNVQHVSSDFHQNGILPLQNISEKPHSLNALF